jgi:hypothetical protein
MLSRRLLELTMCGALLWVVPLAPLAGQKPVDEATKLAKATQNPVADLLSLPFQFNFNHNVEHPTGSAGDQLRMQISFLYPSPSPTKPASP